MKDVMDSRPGEAGEKGREEPGRTERGEDTQELDVGDILAEEPGAAAPAAEGSLAEAARGLIETCTAELEAKPAPADAALLHYEIAHVSESVLGDLEGARTHYRQALEADPEHLPSIEGARRTSLLLGEPAEALSHYEEEIQLLSDPRRKARLHYERGRVLADALSDVGAARAAFAEALELSPNDMTVLFAAARCARAERDWSALCDLYERAANATGDEQLRAALIAERAGVVETRLEDLVAAAPLYEAALRINPNLPGAVKALERIYSARGEWGALLDVLQKLSEWTEGARERALLHYRAARLQAEYLGDRAAAIESLGRAAASAPDEPLILEELVHLYQDAGDAEALSETLRDLVHLTEEPGDRVALLHSLGQIFESRREEEDEAIRCYQEALSIDATYAPALQALGALLARREDWLELVDMHLAEAEASSDTARRTSAHVRAAEIYEFNLERPEDAMTQYSRALALTPGHATAFKALVRLYGRAGERRKLIELYERAVDQASSADHKIAHLFTIGSLWEDAFDDTVQAAHAYRRVLKLRDKDMGALHALQRVCEKGGRYRELVEYLVREANITRNVQLQMSLKHRAAVVLDEHLEDAKAARKLLEETLDLDAAYAPALATLGRIYHREGRWEELLAVYRRELQTRPKGEPRAALLTKMGELCEQQLGRDREAEKCYREALDADSAYRPAVRALLRLLREGKNYKELLRLLDRKLEKMENPAARAHTLYRMAEISDQHLEDTERAIELSKRALETSPACGAAKQLLENLLARTERWEELDEHLESREEQAGDAPGSLLTALERATIWRDRFEEDERALPSFEAAASAGAGLPATLALGDLYSALGDWSSAKEAWSALSEQIEDPAARAAALREVERVQETHAVGTAEERASTCEAIVALEPDDPASLARMAALAEEAGNQKRLSEIYERLGQAAPTDSLAADHQLRLALVQEAAGDPGALAGYRAVLEKAPRSLAAVRGLARLAQRSGNDVTRAEALRREAELRRDPEAAAELFCRSAEIQIDVLWDPDGAVRDLEEALSRDPDAERAADMLISCLRASGQENRLIDVLSRAADSARDPDRRASLWLAVCDIYADGNDLGAAIAALERGLEASPRHAPCRRRLVELYTGNGQWAEAVDAIDELVAADVGDDERCRLLIEQAQMADRHLRDHGRALASAEAALEVAPGSAPALALAARLRLETGDVAAARETAEKLLERAASGVDRADALTLAAAVKRKEGDHEEAETHLAEAVSLVGTSGEAYPALCDLLKQSDNWPALAAALESYVQREDAKELAPAYRTLGVLYGERLEMPERAIEALERGLAVTGDRQVTEELVTRLQSAGRYDDAVKHLTPVVEAAPERPELWRQLAQIYRAQGRSVEARLASMPLVVLGAGTEEDERLLAAGPWRPTSGGTLGADELHELAVEEATSNPGARALAAASSSIGKALGADLREYRLSRRHRIMPGSGHAVRAIVDELSEMMGVECDLYVVAESQAPVFPLLTEPLSILVSDQLARRSPAEQRFLIARPLILAAARLLPAFALPVRAFAEIFEAIVSPPEGSELGARLRKGLSRRERKALDAAVSAHDWEPITSVAAWRRAIHRSANRAAALAADDLVAIANGLADGITGAGEDAPGEALADLLRFWMSGAARRVRVRAGFAPA